MVKVALSWRFRFTCAFLIILTLVHVSCVSKEATLENGTDQFFIHPDPVITGTPGEWDWKNTESPFVFMEDNVYYMFYDGNKPPDLQGYNIGFATSRDGIVWNKSLDNPVLNGTEDWEKGIKYGIYAGRYIVNNPWVIKDGDTYYIWYSGGWNPDFHLGRGIGLAWSTDLVSWTKYEENPVISEMATGPVVIKEGDTYFMWYHSPGPIKLATSEDRVNWTIHGNVLTADPANSWEGNLGNFFVTKYSDIYLMFYSGGNQSGRSIGVAYSKNKKEWRKWRGNPILTKGPLGSWYEMGIYEPSVLIQNGRIHIWHGAWTQTPVLKEQIGYSVSKPSLLQQILNDAKRDLAQ